MNKQGFIKTVEAIIAVLIIFIFIYYVTPKSTTNQDTSDIKKLQEEILKGISEKEIYRECITAEDNQVLLWIQGNNGIDTNFAIPISTNFSPTKCTPTNIPNGIKTFIEQSLTQKFQNNYRLIICTQGSCGSPPEKDTVYTSAVIVTSSLKTTPPTYNPKVVRLYLW
ncbi:MAG: hypothetical protein AABX29_00775 [Nanoarchaeota archaeon]